MKLFTAADIKRLDEYTIRHEPIASIDLMERASAKLSEWLALRFTPQHRVLVCCGAGNNGGDGLAVARMLAERGYTVQVCLLAKPSALSPDAAINYQRLKALTAASIQQCEDGLPNIHPDDVVVDALFGSGLNRPLSGLAATLVRHINASGARVVAVDIPSGLLSEGSSHVPAEAVVRASYTIALQQPKLSCMFPENGECVGELHILPIGIHPAAIANFNTSYHYLTADDLRGVLPKRKQFSHKGSYGHCLLVAGSYGMAGAAVLGARACYRSGAGLLTVHVPSLLVDVLQASVPEAIVSPDSCSTHVSSVSHSPYSAIAVGPGIAKHPDTSHALHRLLKSNVQPLIVDADALNILSENKEWLSLLPADSILTPHPKEFERLVGAWTNDAQRLDKLHAFAATYNVVVVLKGMRTTIAFPNGDAWFNSTGNAGMATAGSGDVLTGILLGLLGQGLDPRYAALLGVYVHGLAGDLAEKQKGMLSLIASDIVDYLPQAFVLLADS